ncbi:hypothetical protein IMSHALPRED_009607 [Imshaugia aleurites]|uniref:Uncharacterized protein n=1 Tax=Imshaugia aleurites TaxID=172621 RepID=A0A8H3IZ27_9LECA|nr:hypothetical protein IMSHALPRED_009607 [Imshaugia aleurites]
MEHGEWPGAEGYPVVMNSRYDRRGRLGSDFLPQRQTVYYQDGNGLLVPAGGAIGGGLHRSHSASAPRRPAQIVINNAQYEDRSLSRSPRGHSHNRKGSHGHDRRYDDSEDEYHERAYSPHRRRRPSRGHESRSPSPYYDYELEKKMKKLEELEEKEKEDLAREKYEEEVLLKEAKKAKKKKEEEELKKKAIEEYHIKELEEKAKKEKEKKEADEEFRERVKKTFGQAGYDEEDIEKILKKGEKGKGHGHGKEIKIKDLTRPTYIKVHQKHVSPETLDEYNLPWGWDERDTNYIVIKQWIPEADQIRATDSRDLPLRPHKETERKEIAPRTHRGTQEGKGQLAACKEEVARKVKIAFQVAVLDVYMMEEAG